MKSKAIVAGVLALAGMSVNAAPLVQPVAGTPGSVFLSLLDSSVGTANSGATYVLNLGVNFETFLANAKAGEGLTINLANDTNWAGFAGHEIGYNIAAGNIRTTTPVNNTDRWGVMLTGSAGATAVAAVGGVCDFGATGCSWSATTANISATMSNISVYEGAVNAEPGFQTGNSVVIPANTPTESWDVAQWGSLLGGAPSVFLGTGVNNNDVADFFWLSNDRTAPGRDGFVQKLGTWQVTTDNKLVFASAFASTTVPVPAAIWLMGSSLLGLVTVARRRQQA